MPGTSPELKLEVIKAGAGAGKTSSLIDTFISSIYRYYKENQIFPKVVVSTFTRKATRELKERLLLKAIEKNDKNLIEYISYSPSLQISTIHGILNRFLQTYGHRIGLSPGFTIINEWSSHELFISTLKEHLLKNPDIAVLLDHYSFKQLSNIMKKYVLHIQQYQKADPVPMKNVKQACKKTITDLLQNSLKKNNQDHLMEIQNTEDTFLQSFDKLSTTLAECGQHILKSWTQKKLELSCIDYNDLEFMSLEIIRKAPFMENPWDLWFLDEYQDTSLIQKEILNHLTRNSTVFIVGDPQQSIYRFRGADTSVFKDTEMKAQQVKSGLVTKKQVNFRSSSELISFFNDVFSDRFEKIEPSIKKYDRTREVARIMLIEKFQNNTKEVENEIIFQRIKALLSNGVQPNNIAILSHKNKTLYRLSHYLKNKNIPVYLHSTGQFHDNKEIKDALFLLRFFLNPHHNENLLCLLRTVYLRIEDQILAQWSQQTDHLSLWSICLKNIPQYSVIQFLNHYLEEAKIHGIIHSFQNALEASGFFDLSYYQDPTGLSEANLWKLIYQLQSHLPGNLLGFVDRLLQDQQLNEQDTETHNAVSATTDFSAVQLMTIHSAKGLEFENVILTGICDNLGRGNENEYFSRDKSSGQWVLSVKSDKLDKQVKSQFQQHILEKEKQEKIQEMDRLFYVALTRAKKTVTLIGSKTSTKNPISANSWMGRFSFFSNLQNGQHSTKYYTYSVEHISHPPSPSENFSLQTTNLIEQKLPWSPLSKEKTIKNFSVQDLLSSETISENPANILNHLSSGLKGQRIHQIMESLHDSDEPTKNNKNLLPVDPEIEDEEVKEILQYMKTVQEIPLMELIHTGYKEWSFCWKIKEHCFFKGRIDLWGKTKKGLWIVDYKTDSSAHKENDFQQLSFYATVLNQLYPNLPIRRCLIYLLQKQYFVEETPLKIIQDCHKQIRNFLL